MNSFIETLNHWGGNFFDFAGTMLWQSSLLIVVLFALDFLFRRKIRASIRYALWLVLLLKLILPPTLALPTSPVWWLYKTPATVQTKPQFQNFTVTYGSDSLPEMPQNWQTVVPPKPKLTLSAWLLLISLSVSAILLLWLLARWWQIARQARRAEISERLTTLAKETQFSAGIKFKFNPPVKLTANTMSPAVCGLFRPVILIPQSLADSFSDEQLRAVLLHELIHLRRRDVWVNFAQSLLQIVYWWQPLVWLANARIRRVREEAVDDAVMLSLRDKTEIYAPTLLEVAKLAFRRPLASLGLVGILESRSALRQRIERLLNFRAPRKAGLTLASIFGIAVFTAVAVPMGEAPSAPNSPDEKDLPATPLGVTQVSWTPTNTPAILIQAEIYRIRQTDFEKLVSDPAFASSQQDKFKNFQQFNRLLKVSGFQPISRPRIQTHNDLPAQFYVGNETNSIEFECRPAVTNGLIDLTSRIKIISTAETMTTTNELIGQAIFESGGGHVFSIRQRNGLGESNIVVVTISAEILTNYSDSKNTLKADQLVQDGKLLYEMGKFDEALDKFAKVLVADPHNADAKYYASLIISQRKDTLVKSTLGRQGIIQKLKSIHLERITFTATPLQDVLRYLSQQTKSKDPEKKGINFLNNPNPDLLSGPPMIDSATGLPITNSTPAAESIDFGTKVTVTLNLTNASLGDVLDAVVHGASKPIYYSVHDYAIVFSSGKSPDSLALYSRHFRVDTNTFFSNLRRTTKLPADAPFWDVFTNYLAFIGVDLRPPKSVFYNERLSELYVRATLSDLDKIENALSKLNIGAPQVHIKARFLEVPKGTLNDLKKIATVPTVPNQTNESARLVGILSGKNFETVLQNLRAQASDYVAEPEATTTSGRQVKMLTTKIITVITNFAFGETKSTNFITVQQGQFETGPILDVIPYVLADDHMIYLQTTASMLDFLGYAEIPTNAVPQTATNSAGEVVTLPAVWPVLEKSQESASVNLLDNQTLVLAGFQSEQVRFGAPDAKREEAVANWIRDGKKKNHADDKELIVFVTVNLIDPAGNRIHPDDKVSSAQNGIPQTTTQIYDPVKNVTVIHTVENGGFTSYVSGNLNDLMPSVQSGIPPQPR
ncbi:MAG TPA: M56 family metallopeptidase [Verrucomicrobiae bacterium]|nr:M56 family metallopeptidase [Verrucomicrobiae bacterium]